LLAEHKAIESHKAQEALAIEKARLAAEWAPLADEHQALKKVVELRDYQVWVRRLIGLIGMVEMFCWGGRELFWVVVDSYAMALAFPSLASLLNYHQPA